MIVAVIMAGGKGERFWPLSRVKKPKQLINFIGKETLLEESIRRVTPVVKKNKIMIATTKELVKPIRKVVPDIPLDNFILEPMGRNTGPALAMANAYVKKFHKDPTVVVLTSDHLILDKNRFREALKTAIQKAEEEECLVTFGIVPDRAETGFGYVKKAKKAKGKYSTPIYKVDKFVEKPSSKKAKEYLRSGDYFWNSGMFVWKASALEKAFQKHCPQLSEFMEGIAPCVGNKKGMSCLKKIVLQAAAVVHRLCGDGKSR